MQSNLWDTLNPNWTAFPRALIGAVICTVFTGLVLYGSDVVLSLYIPEYKQSGQYGIALSIFLVFAAAFLLLGKAREWNNWRYYIIGPIAIFIPLVFIATSFRYLFGIENSFTSYYTVKYCPGSDAMCGKAFAYVFFSMSLRAVPTIFTVAPLFWVISRRTFRNNAAKET